MEKDQEDTRKIQEDTVHHSYCLNGLTLFQTFDFDTKKRKKNQLIILQLFPITIKISLLHLNYINTDPCITLHHRNQSTAWRTSGYRVYDILGIYKGKIVQ